MPLKGVFKKILGLEEKWGVPRSQVWSKKHLLGQKFGPLKNGNLAKKLGTLPRKKIFHRGEKGSQFAQLL